jgi:CBS domain containing-hemolysin-like protein
MFGEILPKSFATKNATTISLLVAPLYNILIKILFPIIIVIEFIIKLVSPKGKKEEITEEEIESFVDM